MTDILLIDQDSQYQRAFARMVHSGDSCRLVGIAENSVDAMNLVNLTRPQMVFCDVMLGLENGLALCRSIKEKFPKTVLYVLSNYCDIRMLKNAMAAGVEEYLFKPISRSKLFELISANREKSQALPVNPYIDNLYTSFEEKNYRKSYSIASDLSEWLFTEFDKNGRKMEMQGLKDGILELVPGLDQTRKKYFENKHEITSRILSKKFLCYHWIIELITEVYQQLCTTRYTHMNKVFRYIEDNKHNEISLTDLSAQAGISSGYLSRIFKKYYKISIVDYIHLRKLLKAKHYMVMSEMNISDISFLMGYSEAGYFCKIFKKYEGETPSAFSRRMR